MRKFILPAAVLCGLLFASTAEARPKPLRWLLGKAKGVASKVVPRAGACSKAKSSKGSNSNCSNGQCSK